MFGMKLQNLATLAALVPYVLAFPHLENFPPYRSLRGLSPEEVEFVERQLDIRGEPGPLPFPPPISFTGTKLVNNADHPFMPDEPDTIRGPCPGLNTLSAHGYINRKGITTPNDIITAVQEGFNMGYDFAKFLCFSAFIVDGNLLTNQMTIGENRTVDGTFITGISTHGNFEGDGSITRQDIYLGDPIHFNETAFDVLVDAANSVGNGVIDVAAGVLDRRNRVEDSIARNPIFSYHSPRITGATAETGFMLALFVHNQTSNSTKPLTVDAARSIFQTHRFPDGFYRRQDPYDFAKVRAFTAELIDLVGIQPGQNEGVNNYVVNPSDPHDFCAFYTGQAMLTARVYHHPRGRLLKALRRATEIYYGTLGDPSCPQVFPFGRDDDNDGDRD